MKTKKFPIDLSMLTEEEIDQFRQDPSTLFEGDTDVSLYLRDSVLPKNINVNDLLALLKLLHSQKK